MNADEKAEWVFSGWMFASSPGLSYMDHPIYDVWVLDCLEAKSDEAPPSDQQPKEGEGEISDDQIPASPEGEAPPVTEMPETTPADDGDLSGQ